VQLFEYSSRSSVNTHNIPATSLLNTQTTLPIEDIPLQRSLFQAFLVYLINGGVCGQFA
jgi:hypothetical protein